MPDFVHWCLIYKLYNHNTKYGRKLILKSTSSDSSCMMSQSVICAQPLSRDIRFSSMLLGDFRSMMSID